MAVSVILWTWSKFVDFEKDIFDETVTYPERFSYRYTGMGAQILALKNEICLYLHYYFTSQAMFLPFKPK